MDIFSHILIGILININLLKLNSLEFVTYAAIMAIFPDFDIFLEVFQLPRKSKLLTHKGISHSFFAGFIVSAVSGVVFSLMTGTPFLYSWMFGFLFYSIHVTLDGLAASKIPMFFPFSKRRFRFFIDRAINPLVAMISGGILLFYLITYFWSPELFYSNLVFYFFASYLIYLSYKITSKIWIQARLPKNYHYVPGILPLIYYIYENHNSDVKLSFKLSKKWQFVPNIVKIIETEIIKGSEEIEFYNIAKTISENYIFFSKWENIIPLIQKEKDYITVLFFLAEGYVFGSAYSLKVVIDRNSKRTLYISDKFGRILPKRLKN